MIFSRNHKFSGYLRRCVASVGWLSLWLVLTMPGVSGRTAAGGQAMRLSKIEFTGLQRLSQTEAVAKSGLQVGQPVDVATLDAAAERLLESGLFKSLSYNYRTAGGQATVTFQVEELKWNVPIVFDNFVWFSDEELFKLIRQHVPTFDGTAPASGTITDQIKKILEDLLRAKKIAGDVEYMATVDSSGKQPEHLFEIKNASIPVCALKFSGAAVVPESELVKSSSAILNNSYSQKFVSAYVENNLLLIYRERGYMRAAFRAPQIKLETNAECQDGVVVTVPVEEGAAYTWNRAEWADHQALSVAELDAALGMRPEELANGAKIDKGLDQVRKAYHRRGYLAADVLPVPVFDETSHRVTYRLNVKEGPQYRMGALTITGLSERDTNFLRGKWRLLPREVYDQSYLEEFSKKVIPEFLKEAQSNGHPLGPFKIDTAIKPNREKLTVDVTVNFR